MVKNRAKQDRKQRNYEPIWSEKDPGADIWHVGGGTYTIRDIMIANGGKWDDENALWIFGGENLPDDITELVGSVPIAQSRQKIRATKTPNGNLWYFGGNVYPVKDIIRANGGKFDGTGRVWFYGGNELPTVIADLIGTLPEYVPFNGEKRKQQQELPVEPKTEEPKRKRRSRRKSKPEPVNGALEDEVPYIPVTPNAPQQREVQLTLPDTDEIITPSWWNEVCTYLIPGQVRPAIAIVGPSGNGKTVVAEAALRAMGYEFGVQDATEYIEPADLVGTMSFGMENGSGGEFWTDGIVTTNFRSGRATLINEWDAMNPRAALCLQSATQDPGSGGRDRYITLAGNSDEPQVWPKGDCPIILTMNTWGTGATREYVGRNTLDAAGYDRLTIISTGYENEAAIIQKHGYDQEIALWLEDWAGTVRSVIDANSLRVILSMRSLLRMSQAIQFYGWSAEQTMQREFFSRISPDMRNIILESL